MDRQYPHPSILYREFALVVGLRYSEPGAPWVPGRFGPSQPPVTLRSQSTLVILGNTGCAGIAARVGF